MEVDGGDMVSDSGALRRAWIAVLLIPVLFLTALALGYVLYDVFGYAPENDDAPLWVDLVSGILPLVLFLVPCVAAGVLGLRTARSGDRRGLLPAGIGALAGLGLTMLTVVTTVSSSGP
jgi:hypothetical protein